MGKQEKKGYHSKSEKLSDRALTDLAIAKIIASIQREPRQGNEDVQTSTNLHQR
jgi:hypothetical protein